MFFSRENDFIISYLPHGFGIKDCIHIRNRCISLGGDIRQRAAPTMEAAVPKPREWPIGLADEAPRAAASIWGARSRPLASTSPRAPSYDRKDTETSTPLPSYNLPRKGVIFIGLYWFPVYLEELYALYPYVVKAENDIEPDLGVYSLFLWR